MRKIMDDMTKPETKKIHPKSFSRYHPLITSTCKQYAVQYGGAGSLLYPPNNQILEAALATGKHCTNYNAEMKSLEQGHQAVIDLTDTTQKM